jgi:DNA-binding response OmpR family regulator
MGTTIPAILIVADKAPARQSLADALVPGVVLRQTTSVQEALSLLREADLPIDLIVIDMNLSESAAVTFTRKLRDPLNTGRCQLPIIVVAEKTASPILKAVQRLGIQGEVAWPLKPEELRALVRRLLPQPMAKNDAKPEAAITVASAPNAIETEKADAATNAASETAGTLVPLPTRPSSAPLRRKWRVGPSPAKLTAFA